MVARASSIGVDDAQRVAAGQGQVGGADGRVGAGPDGHAEVGLGQRGGVVDPVADQGDRGPAGLQVPDGLHLALGLDPGQHVGGRDAQLGGYRTGGVLVVPGDQERPDAQPPDPGDRRGGAAA